MYRFFTDASLINAHDIYIEGADYNHIKNVLRMKTGETVSVSDGISGKEYRCHIEGFEEARVHLRLDFIKEADVELPVKVTLFQGMPKSGKMDSIIEKCVELGVYEIVPVITERSVVKIDGKKALERVRHWQGKAEAAAKQSKRAMIPVVKDVVNFRDAINSTENFDVKLFPYELAEGFDKTREVMSSIKAGESIAVFIGPEGGFSETEVSLAENHGFSSLTLGKRILRTETAAPVVMAWMVYMFEI